MVGVRSISELAASLLQEDATDSEVHVAVKALRHFFEHAYDRGHATKPRQDKGSALGEYRAWLHRQHQSYIRLLLGLLDSHRPVQAQIDSVIGLMEAVRGPRPGHFDHNTFADLVNTLVSSARVNAKVLGSFMGKFLCMRDVQYHCLQAIRTYCSSQAAGKGGAATTSPQPLVKHVLSTGDVLRNVYDTLMAVHDALEGALDGAQQDKEHVPEGVPSIDQHYKTWTGAAEAGVAFVPVTALQRKDRKKRRKLSQQPGVEDSHQQQQQEGTNNERVAAPWLSEAAFRKAYGSAWVALLQLPLPEDVLRKVLLHAPEALLPRMHNPLRLSDFLAAATKKGGLLGILALNSIFLLVTKHGLEYPGFYEQLYQLLTPEAFKASYRSRFFALVDVFLSSGMVPAYTAAAFAKRMARRALHTPPAGACIALAFVHNILRRHPACGVLLHRPQPQGGSAASALSSVDVFDDTAANPAKSNAIESSLWEVEALKQHYSSHVAALAAQLNKDFSDRKKVSEVHLEPLLTASYLGMVEEELKRKLRPSVSFGVAVEYRATPVTQLFEDANLPGWTLL